MGIKSLFKHLLLTTAVLSIYACGGGGESSNKTETIIEVQKQHSTNLVFADQKLTDCVQLLIETQGYTLVEQIKKLDCSGEGIIDIEGIQNLSSLEILDLSNNQIRDITPISKLGKLKQLNLQGNLLQLLSPLTENQLLEQVDISNNDAINCSERAKLDQSIGEENITANQPCVDTMQQAETATFGGEKLQNCIIETAKSLKIQYLEQIQQLKCTNQEIINIDGIEQLENLRELDLTQNSITSIAPLKELNLLKKVLLGHNQITSIQALTSSPYMQELRLDNNQLNDIEGIQALTALKQIHLTNNKIRDITPITQQQLLELRISNNRIIDIQALADLPKLTSLWIQGNQIADLAPLQSLQHLEQLWLSNNWLTDLTPLQTQSKLKWLHLNGTETQDLNPLNKLTQLKWLQLDNTRVDDITAIYPLTKLDWLHLKGNDTIPCSQLKQMENVLTPEKIDRPATCSQPQEQTGNPISTIEFQDEDLRDCVYDAAREQGITNAEELTSLSCPEAGIADTTGLEQLTGITSLEISGNDVNCEQYMQLTYQFGKQIVNPPEMCVKQLTIGGTVSGLGNGTALIIQNNEYDSLEVVENGVFEFSATVADAENYSVQVVANPQEQDQVCTIENGTDLLRGDNISSINITCVNVYSIGGTVNGLEGNTLHIQNNAEIDLEISSNGIFSFTDKVFEGVPYSISVAFQPRYPAQTCLLGNGSGEDIRGDITNIIIECYTNNEITTARSYPDYTTIKVGWNETGADSYTLLYSTQKDFVPAEAEFAMVDVTSLVVIENIDKDKSYYFIVKAEYDEVVQYSDLTVSQLQVKGFNGRINVTKPQDDGTIYVGGEFTRHGTVTGQGLAVDFDTAQSNWLYNPLLSDVSAAVSDGNGGWYVSSSPRYSHYIEIYQDKWKGRSLKHILPDGSIDPEWRPEIDFGRITLGPEDGFSDEISFNPIGRASSLALNDGILYIVGSFSYVNGEKREGVAAINTTGDLLDWYPGEISTESDRTPRLKDMVFADDVIYVGGEFDFIGDKKRKNIAAFSINGEVLPWGVDIELQNMDEFGSLGFCYVDKIRFFQDVVYFSGNFNTVGGQERTKIAAIGIDGELRNWAPILSNTPYSNGEIHYSISGFDVDNSVVYLSGSFDSIDGVKLTKYGFVAVSIGGEQISFLPEYKGFVGEIKVHGERVYLGGSFAVGDSMVEGLAVYTAAGVLLDFNSGAYSVGLLEVSDNELFIGTSENVIGGDIRNKAAAININGDLLDWDPDIRGVSSEVYDLLVDKDRIYIGGDFTSVNSEYRRSFATVDMNGNLLDFGPSSFGGPVRSIAVGENGLYIGGRFNYVASFSRHNLAAINFEGELLDWQPEVVREGGANPSVNSIIINDNGIYISGYFTNINGEDRANIAAMDIDGNLLDWNPVIEREDYSVYINGIAENNGKIFISGNFSTVNSIERNGFAVVDRDENVLDLNIQLENEGELLSCDYISNDFKNMYMRCYSFVDGFPMPYEFTVAVNLLTGSILSAVENAPLINDIQIIDDTIILGTQYFDGIVYGNIAIIDKGYFFNER